MDRRSPVVTESVLRGFTRGGSGRGLSESTRVVGTLAEVISGSRAHSGGRRDASRDVPRGPGDTVGTVETEGRVTRGTDDTEGRRRTYADTGGRGRQSGNRGSRNESTMEESRRKGLREHLTARGRTQGSGEGS